MIISHIFVLYVCMVVKCGFVSFVYRVSDCSDVSTVKVVIPLFQLSMVANLVSHTRPSQLILDANS